MAFAPRLRTIREFAEREIVLPDTGPRGGERYRCQYQPFTTLWFDTIASRIFNRHVATGPSQSGKTLSCCVIPTMYHLFEVCETVIFFSPGMEINEDKWLVDIRPTIEKSRYAEFLPRSGRGSQGGFSELIEFRNGVRLKFMTGGGGDKNKAAFTSRVAIGTEIDGMDEASESSRETDPINQIAARLRSHGSNSVMYLECTLSTEAGRTWKELKAGTDSRIVLQCPHCFDWVTPEREHFLGWEAAATELEAERLGKFYCPECGTGWSQEQRREANNTCKIVHKGQTIGKDGAISGPVPETRTFGFRWSAVNNQFTDERQLGREEWVSARNPDRDAAEKERQQFVWALPFTGEPTGIEITDKIVASRLTGLPRGVVPDDVETLVCQIDIHNRWHYWAVVATSPHDVRSVVDYGLYINPPQDQNGPETAIRIGLEQLAADLEARMWKTLSGRDVELDLKVVDAGYMQDIGLEFVNSRVKWRLAKGHGRDFRVPKERTADLRPGHHWYDSRQAPHEAANHRKWWLVITDTSYWMRQVHSGFTTPTYNSDGTRKPGSIALFGDDPRAHLDVVDRTVSRSSYATQIVAYKWQQFEKPKNGEMIGWVSQYGGHDDHWFDVTYGCLAADLVVRAGRPKEQQKNRIESKPKPNAAPGRFRMLGSGERPQLY